jgi:dTDP-4-amino-4,6-dideoxygalactose transaminase
LARRRRITTFSFFPTKNLTTAEGGAVVTPRPDLEARARKFKNHGLERDRSKMRFPDEGAWHQEVTDFGLNYRLPDVLAALGVSQFRKLEAFKLRRAAIHRAYNDAFADLDAQVPSATAGAAPAWHLYPLRVPADRRKDVFNQLRGLGIRCRSTTSRLLASRLRRSWLPPRHVPNAGAYYARKFRSPLFPGMTDSDVDRGSTPSGRSSGEHLGAGGGPKVVAVIQARMGSSRPRRCCARSVRRALTGRPGGLQARH